MMNYIIQVVLFQIIFLVVYDLFFQKETFFKWNRVYLILTPIIAFVIPWIKFNFFQKTVVQKQFVKLQEVIISPENMLVSVTNKTSTYSYLTIIFVAGVVFFTMLFIWKLIKIINLINSNNIVKKDFYKLVILKSKQAAFSFFNYIFINSKLIKNKEFEIIEHEIIHCKQLHTLDLLFFEILKITMWFNPIIYIFQKRITVLHEYISDAEVIKKSDKTTYFNKLLSETFDIENISFTNQFYKHSLIKKRITMITKNKSQKVNQLKYLVLIPVLVGMLVYTSCKTKSEVNLNEIRKVLKEEIPTKGKYVDSKNGKMFIGNHLNGRVLPLEEYTNKEKQILKKFNERELKDVKLSVVIDTNGDRVLFFNVPITPVIMNKNSDVLPVSVIDNVPVFPSCENVKDQKKCLQEKIAKYISENFNSKLADNLGFKRIFVRFNIDKNGIVTNVKARAPHVILEEEAIRVVKSLPKMIPGKYNGKNVSVEYNLPIAFKLNDNVEAKNEQPLTNNSNSARSISVIDKVPVFPGCENVKDQKKCLQEKMTKYISKNFNLELANNLGLKPGVKRIFVIFKIDENGIVTNVKARAPHIILQEEAIRVVKLLPKMIPGKYNGENVSVDYSLPIAFKLDENVEAKNKNMLDNNK